MELYYKIMLSVVAVYLVFHLGLIVFTRFEKTITIKNKEPYGSGRLMRNTLIDSEGKVYVVQNNFMLLHFNSAQLWMGLEEGKTYKVKGNGVSIPALGVYPNITKVV